MNVLKSAAQGAKSENADSKKSSGLTTSMNDFGYGPEHAADVMSKMVSAVGMAKSNFADFAGALHTAEPLFANIGKSQGLNAEQLHHLMADLYGVTAQMTQSGDSAQHASELIAHAMQKMLNPTAQMRDMMGALGLDAQDIQDHPGERGLAGTMQLLQRAVQEHTKDGKVNLDVRYQSSQLARAEEQAFNGLSPAAKAVAQQIKDGTLSYKDCKSRGGLNVELANEVSQWNTLHNKLAGFSSLIKSGIGDQIGYDQALKLLTGDQETLQVALQTTGENGAKANEKIKEIDGTVREHDGTVKGFVETQTTFNAKLDQAKSAFGAAAIAIGNDFLPAATTALNVVKDVANALAQHPGIMHGVIDALGALGGAWAIFKAAKIAETVLAPIASGLGTIVAEEDAATASTGRLSGALGRLAKGGALALGAQLGGDALQHATGPSGFWHGAAVVGTDAATGAALGSVFGPWGTAIGGIGGAGVGLYHQLAGHSGGGLLRAPGPKGKDSALFWGADGEHVLTADDVDAMGGHGAVYAFRRALHRQGGGAIGPDVQAAYSMIGTPYSQATRHDCSGMVGRVIAGALGIPNVGLPTTVNMGQWLASLGFRPGIGGPGTISVGWYDHGGGNAGHAAMTLSDGENAEAGGSHGNFVVGAGAAGANSPQFDHHMFLPIGDLQGPPGYSAGGGFGGAPEVSAAAASAGRHPGRRNAGPARRPAGLHTRDDESRGRAGTAATSRQRDSRRRRTPQRTQSNRQAVRAGSARPRDRAPAHRARSGAAQARRRRAGRFSPAARWREQFRRVAVRRTARGRLRPLRRGQRLRGVACHLPRRPGDRPDRGRHAGQRHPLQRSGRRLRLGRWIGLRRSRRLRRPRRLRHTAAA
ncbi:hypothetical protein MBOT_40890 [Mycobacterium botniense]|uniref:Phage tail tape measure protein domain-containing protein n=1 Tax=Mycobacterium botniense TaxID=84962 RepID=A0A7I9Y3X7_9MYCO|nr:hypothetical protein MBOT_40890 [Mycobacterium botniense]